MGDDSWVTTARTSLYKNFDEYSWLRGRSNACARRGDLPSAAAYAYAAGSLAAYRHPGIFVDDELEEALVQSSTTTTSLVSSSQNRRGGWPRRVLHVISGMYHV